MELLLHLKVVSLSVGTQQGPGSRQSLGCNQTPFSCHCTCFPKYLLGLTVLKHANVLPFVQRPLLQMLLLQTHPKDCILFVAPLKALVSLSSLEAELTCKCDRFLLFSLILVSLLSKWNAVVQDLQAAMEQVFHKHTVEEWMEENVYPSLEKLQQVVDDLDKAIKARN